MEQTLHSPSYGSKNPLIKKKFEKIIDPVLLTIKICGSCLKDKL
jgi:hypothetical protein